MLHIDSPWYALLFIPLFIALIVQIMRKPATFTISSIDAFKKAVKSNKIFINRTHIPMILEVIGVVFLIIALMRPQKGIERLIEETKGIDIMLLLDVSGSMKTIDIPEDINSDDRIYDAYNSGKLKNRMDVAKKELIKFVKNRPNDKIGLIAFSGDPYSVCPPTLDHDFLIEHLSSLKAGMLTNGTGIAAPISIGTNRLKDSKAKKRVLVLFTDGENNIDVDITPRQSAKLAKTFDTIVYTVGIGSDRAVIPYKSFFGRSSLQQVKTSIDRKLLRDIAETTNGLYFEARDGKSFAKVMKKIEKIEKIDIEQPKYMDYKELFFKWLLLGTALVIGGFILEHTFCMRFP